MAWKLEIDGLRQAIDGLSTTEKKLEPQVLLAEIGTTIADNIRLGFHESRDPWGGSWEKLKHRSGQPLRDTGRLMNSIRPRVSQGEVEVGPDAVAYAAIHHFGGVIKPIKGKKLAFIIDNQKVFADSVTIPARPYMPIDASGNVSLPQSWSQQIEQIILRAIEP